MVSISLGTSTKLDKSGGTLIGPLILSRDPLDDLEAATRRWVLTQIGSGGGGGGVQIGADLGGSDSAPIVIGTHLAAPLPLAQGGTNAIDAPGARAALGLGSAATQSTSAFDAAGAASTAQTNAQNFATSAVATETTRATTAEALLAPLASPALTGTPTAPTQTTGDNSAKLATDAFVTTAVGVETTRAQTAEALKLAIASNLGDVAAPATARGNLGAAKSGANSDITSLTGLTTPLALTGGGTGATAAAAALVNLGAVASDWCDMLGLGLLTAALTDSAVTYQVTAGDLVLCLCTPSKTRSISTLGAWVTAAGVTGSGANALMLFTEAGVLIDQTGDMTAAFSSTGMAEGAMGGSHTVTAGTNYFLGFLTHFSGTSPHFAATGTTQTANFPVVNGHYTAIFKGSQLSVPSSFTPSSYTPNSGYFIMYGR